MRNGFTLIELLGVIFIILLVSVLTLPAVVTALDDVKVSGSAQAVQGALILARDSAKAANAPQGIRLLPSEVNPDVWDRVAPLTTPARYTEGLCSTHQPWPDGFGPFPYLTLLESPRDADGLLATPVAWYWNVRLGDRIMIGKPGHTYTICGPYIAPNDDLFVNAGMGGEWEPFGGAQFLYLVNGRDDDGDGLVDNGWDGLIHGPDGDTFNVWETETWLGPPLIASPYAIIRQPVVDGSKRIVNLSAPISRIGSVVPVNSLNGRVDIMIQPHGLVLPGLPWSQLFSHSQYKILIDSGTNQKSITIVTSSGRIEAGQ